MGITIEQLNPYACKTYLIKNEINEIVIVDPVLEHLNEYLKFLRNKKHKLLYVIDTHTHADHISGCSALKDITGCKYIMHKNAPARCPDLRINDNEKIELINGVGFLFFYTPGHTQDSLSFIVDNYLFTGDTLFLDDGGAGRDDLPGGSAQKHWESLQKYLKLPEDLIVCPAHDYRNRDISSLKKQKVTNPYLNFKSQKEFTEYIEDLKLGPAEWMKEVLKANYTCAQNPKSVWIPIDSPACEVKGTIEKNINEIDVVPITVAELKNLILKNEKIILIDVREPEELKNDLGFIHGSINIPILNITEKLIEIEKYKNNKIIVVCRSGSRAATAAKILTKDGFTNVKVLQGGMISWNDSEN